MMTLWLHRYMKPTPLGSSAVVSFAVHAALIASAVVATASPGVEEGPPAPTTIAQFLAPPNRMGGQLPQREMIRYVALAIPEGVVAAGAPAVRIIEPAAPVVGLDQADASPMPELIGMDSVFSMVEVDSAASRYEWSAAPAFPPRMLAQNQNGFVRAEWVVSEDGSADTTTLRILESSHVDFAKSVRDALPFMRFRPAKIGASTVRQLVQQEFAFRVAVAVDTAPVRKPPL